MRRNLLMKQAYWFDVFNWQAIGQVTYIRPYVTDFSVEWALSAVAALTLGSVITMLIGEKLSDLKLGNGTSLLIFTNIVSYLPASIGRTVAQAVSEGNYPGLAGSIAAFLLLVLGIVYVQVCFFSEILNPFLQR